MRWYIVAIASRRQAQPVECPSHLELHRQRTRHRDREPLRQHELWERQSSGEADADSDRRHPQGSEVVLRFG